MSTRLYEHGFDLFSLLTPDVLHEFELGVWKDVFLHLLRMCNVSNSTSISIVDER